MTLLFLTVMPSPYQRQLFIELERRMPIQVRYFTGGAPDRQWLLPDLMPFERVMPGRTIARLGPSAHWNPGVMAEVAAANPDLVVISDYSALTAQYVMRRLAFSRKAFMFWGEVPGFSKRGPVGTFLRARLQAPLRKAAGIAAIGSVAVEAYQRLFPGKPVFNIPYFCDLKPFQAARAVAKEKQTVDVLFSGQMIDRKGVDVLIEAFLKVGPVHPTLRLLLLGDGPERERLAATVPVALRDRVLFLGHKEPSDLPHVFAAADIFCLPSRHDGWGVVVNEALGAGLPILVSDAVGAGRDLVRTAENGFVTVAGDAAALADRLALLALDAGMRRRMSCRSSELAQGWGVDEGARRWTSAFMGTLSASANAVYG